MDRSRGGPRLLETAPCVERRGQAKLQRLKRLVPWLFGVIVLLLTTYLSVSDGEGAVGPEEPVERHVAQVSAVLASSAAELWSQHAVADLEELLAATLETEDMFAAFVLAPTGRMVAGGGVDLTCLPGKLPLRLPAHEASGRVECGPLVYWSATPLWPERGWLVVGREDVVRHGWVGEVMRWQPLLLFALVVVLGSALPLSQRMAATAAARRAAV